MFGISYSKTRSYFLTNAVFQYGRDQAYKGMRAFGAYVRGISIRSIRKSKSISPPGTPPTTHTGHLKRTILFGAEKRPLSVIIGPTNERFARDSKGAPGVVPPILEYGGVLALVVRGKRRLVRYRARPFMGPAFDRGLERLDNLWTS